MIYTFLSEDMVNKFEKFPEIEKLVKFVEKVELKNGKSAQIQLIITTKENEFVEKDGKHFKGHEQ